MNKYIEEAKRSLQGMDVKVASAEDIMRMVMLDKDGNMKPEARDLIVNRWLDGSFYATLFAAMEEPAIIPKVEAGGLCVLPSDFVIERLSPSAKDFYERCDAQDVFAGIMYHPESVIKTDVGYENEEVMLSLAYAADNSSTSFFCIIKSDDRIKLPRKVIKQTIGTKDMRKAQMQALENLEGVMERGQIGPYPFDVNKPVFYFDESQVKRYGESFVNLPTGDKNLSLYVTFSSIPRVLADCRVEITDIL